MKHVLCRFRNGTKNNQTILGAFLSSAQDFNLDIKEVASHFFKEPEGLTAILLLGESHFSVHTFHETNSYQVDLFSCSPKTDIKAVLNDFAKKTESSIDDVIEVERGIL